MSQSSMASTARTSASRDRLGAIAEILCIYAVILVLLTALRASGWVDWEVRTLGWSYTGALIFAAVPALTLWLARRRWSDYGVTLSDWRTNLEIGMKGFLVSMIPFFFGFGGLAAFKTNYRTIPGGVLMAATEVLAIVLMLWIMRRQKAVASGRANLVVACLLLLLPIALAMMMGKLSVIIVSTVVWQFALSGFGEEFAWRGYIQSRLNEAFGRPYQIFGVSFGQGLIIAAIFFGLVHAFNTFDAADGWASLSWGWALWTTFSGLFFGLIREKTGSLVACGIAHGLPDAVGEALARLFAWV